MRMGEVTMTVEIVLGEVLSVLVVGLTVVVVLLLVVGTACLTCVFEAKVLNIVSAMLLLRVAFVPIVANMASLMLTFLGAFVMRK